MMNLALSCRTMYYAMIVRLWHTLQPRSHMVLRKLKNTLEGRHGSWKSMDPQYSRQVRVFRWSSLKDDPTMTTTTTTTNNVNTTITTTTTTHMFLERPFFDHFLFPRLQRLEFSYAAAQDFAVAPMIRAARHTLRHVDLSHCYCLSTEAISSLLSAPARLETVILYGCGKIDGGALVRLVRQHGATLKCLRLTDITDVVLDAILHYCPLLEDLGLEHCSEEGVSEAGLARFAQAAPRHLSRLRLRDIANLTTPHLGRMAHGLVHLDLSECARIRDLAVLAPLCPALQVLCLAYQAGVSTSAIQQFALYCHDLHHLDVSGSNSSSSEHALLLEDALDPARLGALRELNLSGLEAQLSPDLLFRLLTLLPSLHELCLGVAYDLADAVAILDQINHPRQLYRMNVEKCHTICRIDS